METVGNSMSGKKASPRLENEMPPMTTRMRTIMVAVTRRLTENSDSFMISPFGDADGRAFAEAVIALDDDDVALGEAREDLDHGRILEAQGHRALDGLARLNDIDIRVFEHGLLGHGQGRLVRADFEDDLA